MQDRVAKRLKIGVIITLIVLLVLALVIAFTIVLPHSNTSNQTNNGISFEENQVMEDTPAPGYTITLDTSAHPGAVVSESVIRVDEDTAVEYLPFATLEGMRFTGWYSAPEGDESAVKVDNNSLDLLTVNESTTLYARFETRPTSIDYDSGGLPIIMYHYFYDTSLGETGENANWMDISLFESHLAYFQSKNYYYPTWEEVVAYINGEITLPQPSVVLSSDDGHESFFRLAAPLVKQYDAKMTSFIVLIDSQQWKLDNADNKHIFIQSHSYDMHRGGSDGDARILTSSYQEVYDDAIAGKEFLGNALAYCYPFGKTNDNAMNALRDAGVGVALLIENERAYPLCDPMAVPRLRFNDGATVEYLAKVAY